MTSGIDRSLARARQRISRAEVTVAARLRDAGALLIDTRPQWQQDEYGRIPGAVSIERNHLEWRVDPTSRHRHPAVAAHDGPIVVFCQEGYASSLAVASLVDVGAAGVHDVHDLVGGFAAWADAGLPTEPAAAGPS